MIGKTMFLYSILFENGSVYVGISSNPELRLRRHLCFSGNSGIRKNLREGLKFKFVVHSEHSAEEFKDVENNLISLYSTHNFCILNSKPGGYPIKPKAAHKWFEQL